jgi:hypothetical protein
MKSYFRSNMALGTFLVVVACGGATRERGVAKDAGTSGQLDSGQARDREAADKEVQSCVAVPLPKPCAEGDAACIPDLSADRTGLPTCRTGYGWLPFVVSCGAYDGVVYGGIDSATTYYFDPSDGHPVGFTNTGLTTLMRCGAFDPSFEPTACDSPDKCLPGDAAPNPGSPRSAATRSGGHQRPGDEALAVGALPALAG